MTTVPARIIFAGSPDFALPPLKALAASSHDLIAVLTQPDRPAGRGRHARPSPVKVWADAHGIAVLQPLTLKDAAVQAQLRSLRPDLLVVVAYGLLLPQEVLDIPRLGCVNIHASLLPRWRGAAPIHAAVRAGDHDTGVCPMRMEAGLDTGPVYLCSRTKIAAGECTGDLHDRLATMGADLLTTNLDALLAGQIQALPQSASGASYAPRILKSDAHIDWQHSANDIARQIRAYNPWPVADTLLQGEQLRCWLADVVGTGSELAPGTVITADSAGILVATGEGSLRLLQVQLPGRKPVAAQDLAGTRVLQGIRLGT